MTVSMSLRWMVRFTVNELNLITLQKKTKIFSVRMADLEKAELVTSINIEDGSFNDRFQILGHAVSWVHPNNSDG
jgi:hypothetical protein